MTASTTRPDAPGRPQASQPTYPTILGVTDLLRDDRPIPIGSLAERMDRPRRQVEQAIEQLKRDGYPVICGPRGCWRATTADELLTAYRSERSRALKQLANVRGRLKAIEHMQKVEPLTLWSDAA